MVVALMAVAGMVGVFIGRFLKMPTSEQRERVKEWLLWAVTQAERRAEERRKRRMGVKQAEWECKEELRENENE